MRTFHRWGGLVFIMDDFPNERVKRNLPYWMEGFVSLLLSDYFTSLIGGDSIYRIWALWAFRVIDP